MKYKFAALLGAATLMLPAVAGAQAARTQSGTVNGLTYTAQSLIIGQTSTATIAGGGDPIYQAPKPQYSGVVALIMRYANGNAFICSGSLMADRRTVLTAGHCVSDGSSARPTSTTAYFYGGPNGDTVVPGSPDATPVTVANYFVNPKYTGEVIDQNDIAVLQLTTQAPDFATAYDLYTAGDLTGRAFNIAGYGRRSDTGGSIGANLGTGRLRQGDNRFEFALGEPEFNGFFTDVDPTTGKNFFGKAEIGYSYVSDFDNGLAKNDAACLVAAGVGGTSGRFCDVGVGAREVGVSGGDSGGPQFIDGKLASVTSYGLSFGQNFGDFTTMLDSSFGELNGFVPIFIHTDFIAGAVAAVPEPATWALMIMGFGLVGTAARRSRKPALAA